MAAKVRLQFDFNPKFVKGLDQMKNQMNLTSRVDVVKHALGLLQWALDTRKEGWELLIEKADEQRIVVLPQFPKRG
ncbi:MAG: hypothetical protein Q8Q89_04370 [bacterium]|nr:hypothetical protein [bacterium]